MSQIKIKFPRPLQRVEIIPQKDLQDKEVTDYIPGELAKQGIEHFFDGVNSFEDERGKLIEDVFTQEIKISHTKEPIEISLDKLSEQMIPISNLQFQVNEAYERGFNEGVESVKAEMEANLEQARNFENIINEYNRLYKQELAKLDESLVSLSVIVAEHIINREISDDSNIIIEQARKAIEALDDEIIFKINLNPADVETLKAAKSTLVSDSSRIENCEIVPDNSIERGFCVLSSSVGVVDARLRTQLEMLKKSLLDEIKKEEE